MPSYREYQQILRPGLQNPFKRPQLSIQRSVKGCLNCKKRRVKCDETKATCVRCQKRKEECIWPILQKKTKARNHPEDSNQSANGDMLLKAAPGIAHYQPSNVIKSINDSSLSKDTQKSVPSDPANITGFETLTSMRQEVSLDRFFLANFAHYFLPPFAQVHFTDRQEFQSAVIQVAGQSELLMEVFIACGASFVASENVSQRRIAYKRYSEALFRYKASLKSDSIEKQEIWLFIAAQVLQILCLREPFSDSNATRCAFHFALAHKFVAHRLSRKSSYSSLIPIEKRLIENFIFHYPLVILFCDHTQLSTLVPDPFQFFSQYQNGLILAFSEDAVSKYGTNPLVAFHIAAKCSWLCRLGLPLNEAQRAAHMDLLAIATESLCSVKAEIFSDCMVQVTYSITSMVLSSAIILLKKMLDMNGCHLLELQPHVSSIRYEIEGMCHVAMAIPIWSLMIAACASVADADRRFFRAKLAELHDNSRSKLIEKIVSQLDDVWAVGGTTEPFDLLFDTEFMSQICS